MSFSSVLLILLSLLPVVDQAATFVVNVTQSSYEAVKNHSITLEWTFTTRTQGSYRELNVICSLLAPHGDQVLYHVYDGVEILGNQDDQFSGRVHSDKDVLREGRIRLHVSRLRTEDSGRYLCEVKTEDGVGSARCRLDVLDQYEVVGHEPIHAKVGHDVILPCHLVPPFDVSDLTIEWRFKDRKIHVHRGGSKDDETPDPKYKGRTFMFHDEFRKGNISLKLTNLVKEDDGNYICFVPKLETQVKKGYVTLKVDENGPKGELTDLEGGNGDNNGRDIGLSVGSLVCIITYFIIIIIIIIIAGLCYWQRKRNQRRLDRGGGRQRPEPAEQIIGPTTSTLWKKHFAEEMATQELKMKEDLYLTRDNQTKVDESSTLS